MTFPTPCRPNRVTPPLPPPPLPPPPYRPAPRTPPAPAAVEWCAARRSHPLRTRTSGYEAADWRSSSVRRCPPCCRYRRRISECLRPTGNLFIKKKKIIIIINKIRVFYFRLYKANIHNTTSMHDKYEPVHSGRLHTGRVISCLHFRLYQVCNTWCVLQQSGTADAKQKVRSRKETFSYDLLRPSSYSFQ